MTDLIVSADVVKVTAAYLLSVAQIATVTDGRVAEKLRDKKLGTQFPALRITEISTADGDTADGWARSLLQIDCFHTTRTDAADLARDVCAALLAAAGQTIDGVALGRAETVRRRPAHDTSFDPPQPRWIVTCHLLAKPS